MIRTVPKKENETAGPANVLQPQLVMCRPTLQSLPELDLPEGYYIRSYREGDDAAWEHIIRQSFDIPIDAGAFTAQIKSKPIFQPQRVLFVIYQNTPVATATAWLMPKFGDQIGYLHMVGVLPEQRGKKLGYWVSLAVLHRIAIERRNTAVLETDDFRISAVKTYLQLGFEPFLVSENQRTRWRNIFKVFDNGYAKRLMDQFEPMLSGPVHILGSPEGGQAAPGQE